MTKGRYCFILALTLAACGPGGGDSDDRVPTTPYERYVFGLETSGLQGSALVNDWIAAGTRALEAPLPVFAPHREVGYFEKDAARAIGYRIDAQRGQRILVEVDLAGMEEGRVFVDLYRAGRDSLTPPIHLATADSLSGVLTFDAYFDGSYLLRIQPEVLRGGRYQIDVRNMASYQFPVANHGSSAIRSFFGDPRDGGRRDHHGVDIFAPRGTPVVASVSGRATSGNNRLGGKVVWLRDPRGRTLYYAHLDSVAIARRQIVNVGDTLGFVGNSGNAITTPPHLHYGIYFSGAGPVDPEPFINEVDTVMRPVLASTEPLGSWTRSVSATSIRSEPRSSASALERISSSTVVQITGAYRDWYRVTLPDGLTGYVPARLIDATGEPVRITNLARTELLHDAPGPMAQVKDSLAAGLEIAVVGDFRDYQLVRTSGGFEGWVRQAEASGGGTDFAGGE